MKIIGGYLDRRVPALADHIVTVTDDIRHALISSKVAMPHQRLARRAPLRSVMIVGLPR